MMASYPCNCRGIRVGGVVTVSVILGIIAAFLRFAGTVAVGTTFLWAVFAAAVGTLGVALIVSGTSACCAQLSPCACPLLATTLIGALGSTLLSNVLLSATLAATSVLGAALFGVLILFFVLMLLSTAALTWQLSRCDD